MGNLAKACLALSLSLLLWDSNLELGFGRRDLTVAMLCCEFFLCWGLGWLGCLSLEVASATGAILDLQTGLSNAVVLDPARGESTRLFASLYRGMAALVFLQMNGPSLLVLALSYSLKGFPLGDSMSGFFQSTFLVGVGSWFFASFVGLGLPFWGAIWLFDLASGFLGRLLPQLNVLSLGPPAKVLIAWSLTLWWIQHQAQGLAGLHRHCLNWLGL